MGRQNLPPKKRLGRRLDKKSLDVSRQLSRITANALASSKAQPDSGDPIDRSGFWPTQASPPPAAMEEAAMEASMVEDLAFYQGADVLFASGKEGPITALAIILIPEENRQNRRIAALAANFGFVAHLSGKRKIAVVVPEGYVTDFASIPGFVQWLIQPFGKHSEAAVIHDWLYTLGTRGDKKGRKLADRTFRRALALVGVGWVRRSLMYRAVRMGGGSGYGLASDYDFRDLVELKRRDPLPDKNTFAYTWREAEIPKPQKATRSKKHDTGPAASTAPITQKEAKEEAQQTMVATEKL